MLCHWLLFFSKKAASQALAGAFAVGCDGLGVEFGGIGRQDWSVSPPLATFFSSPISILFSLRAFSYTNSYTQDIRFDNLYISRYFRQIDARRRKQVGAAGVCRLARWPGGGGQQSQPEGVVVVGGRGQRAFGGRKQSPCGVLRPMKDSSLSKLLVTRAEVEPPHPETVYLWM